MNRIEAVIFDMDDLMIKSHQVHMGIFRDVLESYGVRIPSDALTREEELRFFGENIKVPLDYVRQKYGLAAIPLDEFHQRYNELMLPAFEQRAEPMPGLNELIDELKGKYKLGHASTSIRQKIDIVHRKLGIQGLFDAVTSGEDEIPHGKPAPDIYLVTAEKLGVQPQDCLVLEDAPNGVAAGKAAGMTVWGVHNQSIYERLGIRLDLSQADRQMYSLVEARDAIRQMERI